MDFNWHGAEPNTGHNSAMLALQIYCAKYNGKSRPRAISRNNPSIDVTPPLVPETRF